MNIDIKRFRVRICIVLRKPTAEFVADVGVGAQCQATAPLGQALPGPRQANPGNCSPCREVSWGS